MPFTSSNPILQSSRPAPSLVVVLAGLSLLGLQCGDADRPPVTNSRDDSVQSPSRIPPDLRIRLGTGGGFLGQWSGYEIRADGTLLSWSGRGISADSTLAGTLPTDSLLALSDAIDAAEFFQDRTDDPGNISAFLEVKRDGRENRVTWVPSVASLEPPKSPTDALYHRIVAMINAVADP